MAAPCVGSLEMCPTHEPGDDSDGEKEGDINHEVGGEASSGEVEDNQALTVGMEAEAGEKSHDEDKEPLETLKGATLNNCGDPGRQDPSPLSGSLLDMFIAIASSRVPIKSQQKGDPEFSQEQKMSMLLDLYKSKPLIFLERFRKVLTEEHLGCFSHLCGDYTAEFYCKEIRRASHKRVGRTRVRNKRYAALQQLITAGEYFSDEQMRLRDPLLYEHYVGQYLTEEEVMSQNSKDLSEACSLSDVLLTSYQEQALQRRLIAQIEQEESCMEEEEEESEEEEQAVDSEERALLREEFISRMHQRFLDGKDQDFDYSEVDDNPDFDNLDIVTHDEEERYFDDDDDDDDDTEEMEAEEGENGRTDKGHTFCVGTH